MTKGRLITEGARCVGLEGQRGGIVLMDPENQLLVLPQFPVSKSVQHHPNTHKNVR